MATPHNISAGDGSESAYQRIRAGHHQAATVPEPLATCRAGSWSTSSTAPSPAKNGPATSRRVHLVTPDNVGFDGGPKNVFDPDNGYRDAYKKIWAVN
jgi:ribose transport system substrate-binding protein